MPRDLSPPAFLFYPDDFASDGKVEAMTTEAVGCYILLLCKAWRENPAGTIPDDDRRLSRWARVSEERWAALRPEVLSPFEPSNDGRLVQKRLRSEYDKQRRNRRVRSQAGKLGAAATWQKNGNAIGNALTQEDESESEDESVSGLFESFWSVFPSGRKKSKGKAREAFEKALRKVDASEIIRAAEAYAQSDEGQGQYVKMPSTWLNGECWSDDRESWTERGPKARAVPQLPEDD